MKRILKFPLNLCEMNTEIKCNFVRVLDIQIQHGVPTAWILTSDDVPMEAITIVPVGTGWEINGGIYDDALEYVCTVQDNAGFVWHYHLLKG